MAKQVTFIHAADLHIGAPFRGLRSLSPEWSKRLERAIMEAYARVIDAAIDNEVDFVIIAGDVFDTARASYGDYTGFFKGLQRLDEADIPVYLVTGNHDPYTSWSRDFVEFPPNTVMFGAESPTFAAYSRNGKPLCLLGGRSFFNQTWPEDCDISEGISREEAVLALKRQFTAGADAARGVHAQPDSKFEADLKAIDKAPFMVGVIHTGLDKDFKAPVKPASLLDRGVDYWACGHIHRRQAYPSLKDPRVVFSGDVQGRDINEDGSRGCYLVTLEEKKDPQLRFIPTASVVWEKLKVDVSECLTVADVTSAILKEMFSANGKAQCEEMCVRVTLTGKTDLHETLSRGRVIEDIRENVNASYPVFFCDAIIDKTSAPFDKKALVKEGLFPASLMAIADQARKSPAELNRYLTEEFLARGLDLPADVIEHPKRCVNAAEDFALDLLMEASK